MYKRGDTLSLRVLIGRGLDLLVIFIASLVHCSILSVQKCIFIVGVYYAEGPPVPIPNTVVKLSSAENTWLETARENKSMPTSAPEV